MKKALVFGLILILVVSILTGCGSSKVKSAIGADNWKELTDEEKNEVTHYWDTYEGDEEEKIEQVQTWYKNSRISKDLNLSYDIVSNLQVTVCNEKIYTEVKNNAPIEITITKDGAIITPSSGIDSFISYFEEIQMCSISDLKTLVKNHKIVITIDEKTRITSDLIDTDTGESLSL